MNIDYLNVFIDWSKRSYSRARSAKQWRFFMRKLSEAIKQHKAAGLVVDEWGFHGESEKMFSFIFETDGNGEDTKYVQVNTNALGKSLSVEVVGF